MVNLYLDGIQGYDAVPEDTKAKKLKAFVKTLVEQCGNDDAKLFAIELRKFCEKLLKMF